MAKLIRNYGERHDRILFDFLKDAWVMGSPPGNSLGYMRVQLTGAGPGSQEVAVDPGLVRVPLYEDALKNLRVILAGPGGNPVNVPIGGTFPNDFLRVFNVAPATGQYFVAPGDWNNGDAKPLLADVKGRLVVTADPAVPIPVTLPAGSQRVYTDREQQPGGIRQQLEDLDNITPVSTLKWASNGKLGEVWVSPDDSAIEVVIAIDGSPVGGGHVTAGNTVPFVFTVPPDVVGTKDVTVTRSAIGGNPVPTKTKVTIRGWYN